MRIKIILFVVALYSAACGAVVDINGLADAIDNATDADAIAVTGISLEGEEFLLIDETVDFTVTISPTDASDTTYTLVSSHPAIVAVADNAVTGKSIGTATITAKSTDGEFTATLIVIVDGDSDGDGMNDSEDPDDDNDGVDDVDDADHDNDLYLDIYTIEDLNAIRNNLTASAAGLQGVPDTGLGYELMNDLDFNDDASYADPSNKSDYTTGSGWLPIPDFDTRLIGRGYAIKNLFIDRNTSAVGLIGNGAANMQMSIENLYLTDVNVTGVSNVGALVGQLYDLESVKHVTATGTVVANSNVGGLIGHCNGLVDYADVDVDVSAAGGLVGGAIGYATTGGILGCNVTYVIARGDVVGNTDNTPNASLNVGGLVGWVNISGIQDSSAHGNVSAVGHNVGGLVGYAYQSIMARVYATGDVTGRNNVGGLIGYFTGPGSQASQVFTSGNVTGEDSVGGVLGALSRQLQDVYSVANVQGTTNVGGIVAQQAGSITRGFFAGTVTGTSGLGIIIGSVAGAAAVSVFYDSTLNVDNVSDAFGGAPYTTSELQTPTSNSTPFGGFDTSKWEFGSSTQYPHLKNLNGAARP